MPQRGKQIGYTCLGCHGIEDYKNVYPTYSVPKLVGQHPEYLVAALKAYRGKQRSHGTMYAQASSLSDQDMEDVAAYLVPAPLPQERAGRRHRADQGDRAVLGAATAPTAWASWPTIRRWPASTPITWRGRWWNTRRATARTLIMQSFVAQLSAADIKSIADYYGAQQPELQTVARRNWR